MTYIYRFTIKETHECYVGQHRTTTCDDPYKDWYKGSGVNWVQLLKLYDLWELKKFRKGVKKEILKVWHDDVSREEVGQAEKEAIEQTRELYQGLFSDFCLNVYDGSLPSWQYDTLEEAELAIKEQTKKYRETHKEEEKEQNKQYYENHKDELKQRYKQYYENHKDEIKEWQKQYRETHKEEKKEWHKQYYENHKEELKQYGKQYYENNKDKIKEKSKQYRQLPQVKLANEVKTWKLKHNYPSPDTAIFPKSWTDKEITEYKRQWEKHNEL